jgi:L-seryl-tRNA(Ser) seleniumtransferase
MSQSNLRFLPSVEKVLASIGEVADVARPTVTALVREEVETMRLELLDGSEPLDFDAAVARIREKIDAFSRQRLQPVINGTGVLIHTNLGRSPVQPAALELALSVAVGYSNLEFDLASGARGHRGAFLEKNLAVLCKAEAATVVNNCASALVLILRELANGVRNEVIIGRNQLVEIGGGFRVPEIMETSGAKLREVGATNRVSLDDYRNAIGDHTGMILRVHRSNFYMEGFVDEPTTEELVELAREHDLPIVEDLGSGAMVRTDELALIDREPTTAEVLAQGVNLVCVSGDKLFGGVQAGMIAGDAQMVARLKRNPFFRALRCDKLVLATLQETISAYLNQSSGGDLDLPLLKMLSGKPEALKTRAQQIISRSGLTAGISISEGVSRCGGGTMPKAEIPSVTLDLSPAGTPARVVLEQMRNSQTPVIGYVSEDRVKLDVRTVLPSQDILLAEMLQSLCCFSQVVRRA